MSRRDFFVARDGVRLRAVEEGNPECPIVVFVHGYPDDLSVWDGVVEQLLDDARIVRYDVRGAGLSDAPKKKSAYLNHELTQDLLAVVDAVEEGACFHLVGHDWGSIQLWDAVTDPDLVHRILSFVSASGPSVDYVAAQARKAMFQEGWAEKAKALNQAMHSWYIALFQLPWLPEWSWSERVSPFVLKGIAKAEGIPFERLDTPHRVKNGRHGVALYRANMPKRLTSPTPRPSDVPVHVLVPKQDNYVSTYIAYACEPWLSTVQFEEVDGGHWFFLKNPDPFVQAVRQHLKFW